MNKLIQKIFENRGYTQDFLYDINNPQYQLFKDVDRLCVMLKRIHDEGLYITIYPDFDMDGIAAGTTGFAGFTELGFNVSLYIPDPSAGYGISQKSVADLLYKHPETQVIITCDTGIGAAEAAAYCQTAGIEFIVTDHHKQEVVIPATIIIDPVRQDETYPHKVCGAFVLWQILMRYSELYGSYVMQDQIARLKVFAGIGTISDSIPLLYENRQLVRDAVMICRLVYGDGSADAVSCIQGTDQYKLAFWGLYDFIKVCEEKAIIKSVTDIDEDFFGWYLAPIFNSAKRMNGNMQEVFGIFFCGNMGEDNPRKHFAETLYMLNGRRKELVAKKFKELMTQPQPYAPYIYISDADPGILGLLAMKIMSSSGVPTFVMADHGIKMSGNRYSGSGRSPEWFPSISQLHDLDYFFIAGHEYAFGCGIDTETHLRQFFGYLSTLVPNIMVKANIGEAKPDYIIDTQWGRGDIGIDIGVFEEFLSEIDNYKPFGKGFELPVGQIRFRNQDTLGWTTMSNGTHLKISLPSGFDIICWNQGHLISQKNLFKDHVVNGSLKINNFKGDFSINFVGDFIPQ